VVQVEILDITSLKLCRQAKPAEKLVQ